jgi:hypothetical protein
MDAPPAGWMPRRPDGCPAGRMDAPPAGWMPRRRRGVTATVPAARGPAARPPAQAAPVGAVSRAVSLPPAPPISIHSRETLTRRFPSRFGPSST